MKQITFELDVPISAWASFRIVEGRTLTEENVCGREPFNRLVEHIKRLGCKYKIEELVPPVLLEAAAQRSGDHG